MINQQYAALKEERPEMTRKELRRLLKEFRKWKKRKPTKSILEDIKNDELRESEDSVL